MAISAIGPSKGRMRSRHRSASRIGVRLGCCRSLGSRGADIISRPKEGRRTLCGDAILCDGRLLSRHCTVCTVWQLCSVQCACVDCPNQNWVCFVIRAWPVVYFSPRLLCRFDLAVKAISIRRRMASGRPRQLIGSCGTSCPNTLCILRLKFAPRHLHVIVGL